MELVPQPLQPLNKHQITHLSLYTVILTHNQLMLTPIRICWHSTSQRLKSNYKCVNVIAIVARLVFPEHVPTCFDLRGHNCKDNLVNSDISHMSLTLINKPRN